MGQISSPLSMRYTKSMQWPSLWTDSINYNKKIKVDIFTNMVLPLLFNEALYLNKYTNNFILNFYLNSSLKKINLILKNYYENTFFRKRIAHNSLESLTPFFLSFFGKVWLIRFNKWLILVSYVYSPKKIKINKISLKKPLTISNYVNWKKQSNYKIFNSFKKQSLIFYF